MSKTVQPLSPSTSAEQQTCRHGPGSDVIGQAPGPIDKWLIANARSLRMGFLQDYLLLIDPKVEYVDCYVELLCEDLAGTYDKDSDRSVKMYTLYITAKVPPSAQAILFLRTSPRVILDRFIGSREALEAPLWARWSEPSLEFQQPKSTFAALFIRMATWELNSEQPGLPYQMAQWARSIMASTTTTGRSFKPATPQSGQQLAYPVLSRKRRAPSSSSETSTDDVSPTPLPSRRALKRSYAKMNVLMSSD